MPPGDYIVFCIASEIGITESRVLIVVSMDLLELRFDRHEYRDSYIFWIGQDNKEHGDTNYKISLVSSSS